jgi:hypothetical protein
VQTRAPERFRGPLTRVEDGHLVLGERPIALSDVDAVWLRGRATRRGAAIGVIAGGGAGLLFAGWFAALVSTTGDGEDGAVGLVLGGTLIGAAGGGALGGAIGATTARWRQLHPESGIRVPLALGVPEVDLSPTPVATRGPRARRFAAVEGALGHGRSPEDGGTSGGIGARLALLSEYGSTDRGGLRPFAEFGPEIGYQALGSTGPRRALRIRSVCLPNGPCDTVVDSVAVRREYAALDAGGVLRVGIDGGVLEPYGLVGSGVQVRRVTTTPVAGPDGDFGIPGSNYIVGYSAGGGVQARPRSLPFAFGVEARWRSNLFDGQSDGIDEAFGFWTLGATVKRSW